MPFIGNLVTGTICAQAAPKGIKKIKSVVVVFSGIATQKPLLLKKKREEFFRALFPSRLFLSERETVLANAAFGTFVLFHLRWCSVQFNLLSFRTTTGDAILYADFPLLEYCNIK